MLGGAFSIASFREVREPFWRRPMTPLGRRVRVSDVMLSPLGSPSIAEVRARASRAVEQDRAQWGAVLDPTELLIAILHCSSVRDIMNVFDAPR